MSALARIQAAAIARRKAALAVANTGSSNQERLEAITNEQATHTTSSTPAASGSPVNTAQQSPDNGMATTSGCKQSDISQDTRPPAYSAMVERRLARSSGGHIRDNAFNSSSLNSNVSSSNVNGAGLGASDNSNNPVAPVAPVQLGQGSASGSAELDKSEVQIDDLNLEQTAAVKLALAGESFCLIGPAGSGKTTTVKCMVSALLASGMIGRTNSDDAVTKFFKSPSMLRVAIVSFTNQAVRNIRESVDDTLKNNCSTIHKLVEFKPVVYADENDLDEDGEATTKQIFAPTFGTLWNQAGGELLPHFDVLIIEESGSVALELFELLTSALPFPETTQLILLGDLEQLPPVFDDAILGFKQLELPVIELVQVYRNVGIITQLAHRVLEGRPIMDKEAEKLTRVCPTTGDSIRFVKFQKKYDDLQACQQLGLWLKRAIIDGTFNPEATMILIPFGKKFGSLELNKYIMQGITERDSKEVYEVLTRFGKSYWSVGDKVLHDRNHYTIAEIGYNSLYVGQTPIEPSPYLTRFGTALRGKKEEVFGTIQDTLSSDGVEAAMNGTLAELEEPSTNQASHIIKLVAKEEDQSDLTLRSGAINNMVPTYAMTVHKAQGSEADNVLLILHHSHSVMGTRELFYTGLTRAKHHLTVMYSGNYTNSATMHKYSMLHKCLVNQKIPGRNATEKLKYFRNKARSYISSGDDGAMRQRLISLQQQGLL